MGQGRPSLGKTTTCVSAVQLNVTDEGDGVLGCWPQGAPSDQPGRPHPSAASSRSQIITPPSTVTQAHYLYLHPRLCPAARGMFCRHQKYQAIPHATSLPGDTGKGGSTPT